jgi:hypothetical protein
MVVHQFRRARSSRALRIPVPLDNFICSASHDLEAPSFNRKGLL